MIEYLLYFLVPLILILVFFLVKLIIVKYFEARKKKFSKDSNYPIVFGIFILFSAFLAAITGVSPLIELLAKLINNIFETQLKITNTLNIYSLIMFGLLCISVVLIFLVYYRSYRMKKELAKKSEMKRTQEIVFPPDPKTESPIFHERIKELFILKYKKNNLKLEYDSQGKILFGKFKEGLHEFSLIIFCDESVSDKTITKVMQNKTYNYLKKNVGPRITKGNKDGIVDIYYLLEKGKFEKNKNEKLITLTEDDFLNEIIDFRRYLEELVYKYKNDKLFSAIVKEDDKFTLEKTFIRPSFNDKKENLDRYLDNWLLESGLKHYVILGDYGMGKSSFLKFYSAKLAEEILSGKKVKRYPVFISLTNTSPMHGGIKKSVGHFVSEKLGVSSEIFQKLVHRGKILFILDGFDEMGFIGTHEQRFEQFNAIWQLATKNNKILLAGRPSYFPTEFEMKSTLNIAEKENEATQVKPYCEKLILDRFDKKRIEQSIKKYYPDKIQFNQYLSFIKNNESINDLCSRPSMMHIIREMLPDIHRKFKSETLTAGKLMKQYVEYWIDRQESKCIQSAFKGNSQKKKDFIIDFFKELAENFCKSKELKISAKDIGEKLKTKYRDLHFEDENKEIIQGFESEILTGYFIEIEGNEYRFVHKSFFEYFVSIRIVELIKSKDLKNPLMKQDWSFEIIDFIYDFIGKDKYHDQNIPSLLYALHSERVAKIKSTCFRFMVAFLNAFDKKPFLMVFLFILFPVPFTLFVIVELQIDFNASLLIHVIFIMISISLTAVLDSIVEKSRIFNFGIKSYQIAFIKKEILLDKSPKVVNYFLRKRKRFFLKNINDIKINNIYFFPFSYFDKLSITDTEFISCDLSLSRFSDSTLRNVFFNKTNINFTKFQNCKFQNVNFENVNLKFPSSLNKKMLYYFLFGIVYIKKSKKHVINPFNAIFNPRQRHGNLLEFQNIEKSDMDEITLDSLRKLVKGKNLVVGDHIVCDEWLMEDLKK